MTNQPKDRMDGGSDLVTVVIQGPVPPDLDRDIREAMFRHSHNFGGR